MSGPEPSNPRPGPAQEAPHDTGLRPEDVVPGRPVPLQTPWGDFALYPTDRGVYCAASFCPHLMGPLWEGSLVGTEMTCPWHFWRYDVATGRCVQVPGCDDPPEGVVPREQATIQRLVVRISAAGTYEVVGPPR